MDFLIKNIKDEAVISFRKITKDEGKRQGRMFADIVAFYKENWNKN